MKLPRDLSGRDLAKSLGRLGYEKTRQTGSHIRLTARRSSGEYHVTIPDHPSLRVGTLSNILKQLAAHEETSMDELVDRLFG